jgi:hypothetical protein
MEETDSLPLDHITNQLYLPSSRSLVLLLKEQRILPVISMHTFLAWNNPATLGINF